jgi:signal transduction histidine kinase
MNHVPGPSTDRGPTAGSLAWRVSLLYLAAAGLWILLSDRALALWLRDRSGDPWPQTIKGWLFVVVTAAILHVLVRRSFASLLRARSETQAALREATAAREDLRRHAADLETRVAERTAALQEVNAELESFSYSVSHDLRAPLRAMQGFAAALLEDQADRLDATGRDHARRIVAAGARMDAAIQDLLAYSRLAHAELRLESVDVEALVEELVAHMETEIRGRNARVAVHRPLPRVRAHRSTLRQVVTNLVANALKFVPPGAPPKVEVRGEERDGRVRLWIEDNGIGIPAEHHERIFRVFERLHGVETYPGTGIGLATVRRAMERMGGRAGVESAPGRGSRFWIELARGDAAG